MSINVEDVINQIRNESIDTKKESSPPRVVFLGGVPGAGKTKLCEKVLEENPEHEFIIIDVDQYRQYFKNDSEEAIPKTEIVEKSIPFANSIADRVLEESLKARKNIIIDTALGQTNLMLNFINNRFIPLGYKIDIAVLTTPLYEGLISSQERYEEQIENDEFPRFTTVEFLETMEKGLIETLKILENMPDIENINLYTRAKSKEEMPIIKYNKKTEPTIYSSVIEAYMNIREQQSNNENVNQQIVRIQELYNKRKCRNASPKEFNILRAILDYYGNIKNRDEEREVSNKIS